jgi:Membrane bound FAD containing D-sorbitol dehydrogenase
MPTFSRRAFILGGACALSAASAIPLFAGAKGIITVEEFRALSARLTGANLTDLNATAAAKLLDGFLSTGRGEDLTRLAADPGAKAGPLADDIVAAWYSGNYRTAAGLASIGLPGALLWDALNFTKPSGFCGGLTGYWGEAPQS